jgi:hypothetical protein
MLAQIIYPYNFQSIKQVRNVLVKFNEKKDLIEFLDRSIFPPTTFSEDYFLIEGSFYVMMRFKDKIFLTPEMNVKNENITFFTIRSPNRFIGMNQESKIKKNDIKSKQ